MAPEGNTSANIHGWLERLKAGDAAARDELIRHSQERLGQLAHRMLRSSRVKRWEQTDDVLNRALLRLHKALSEVQPDSVGGFFGLAAEQIRRELIDLYRHHFGRDGTKGRAARHESDPAGNKTTGAAFKPESLEEWAAFHQKVQDLPEKEKAVVDLLFYQGKKQAEAAAILDVDVKTVKNRWQSAQLLLHAALAEK
jgi:RNA polymerase sigma factor (sigma-70 family)